MFNSKKLIVLIIALAMVTFFVSPSIISAQETEDLGLLLVTLPEGAGIADNLPIYTDASLESPAGGIPNGSYVWVGSQVEGTPLINNVYFSVAEVKAAIYLSGGTWNIAVFEPIAYIPTQAFIDGKWVPMYKDPGDAIEDPVLRLLASWRPELFAGGPPPPPPTMAMSSFTGTVNAQPDTKLDTWDEETQIPEWVKSPTTIDGITGYYLQSSTGTGTDQARLEYTFHDSAGNPQPFEVPAGYALHFNAVYAELYLPGNEADPATADDLIYTSDTLADGQMGIYITFPAGTVINGFTLVDGMALLVEERYAQEEFCNRLATAVVNDWARDVQLVPTTWGNDFCGDKLRIMPKDERPGGTTLPDDLTPVDLTLVG